MGGEANPVLAFVLERLNIAGVEGGGSGARVDFGTQAAQPQFGQGNPLAQADRAQVVKGFQGERSPDVGFARFRCLAARLATVVMRSKEHTSELQSRENIEW